MVSHWLSVCLSIWADKCILVCLYIMDTSVYFSEIYFVETQSQTTCMSIMLCTDADTEVYICPLSLFSFPDNNFSRYQWIFTKLCMCIDIVEICIELLMVKFHQFLTELSAHHMIVAGYYHFKFFLF